MPLPASVTTVPIHIKIVSPVDGTPGKGRVLFTGPYALRDTTDNVIMGPPQFSATLDANGEATVNLIANDDPDISPSGWAYTVYVATDVWRPDPWQIQIPAATVGTLELADIAPAVTPTTVTTYALDSAAVHKTGAETIAGVKTFSSAPVVPSGSFPESAVANLTSDLSAKAPTSRQILAGTGLTGGGDLTTDRTFNVNVGTTAGTVAAGDDSRIVNAAGTADIQTFTASGTWTKPAGAKLVAVTLISGGGGGGSGRRGAAGTARVAGGGGGSSGRLTAQIPASVLPASVSVTVGAGGAGGAAIGVDSTDGQSGGGGGSSQFGVYAKEGVTGGGGGGQQGTGGGGGFGSAYGGSGGGNASTSGGAGGSVFLGGGCGQGAAGGGITSGDVASGGGNGSAGGTTNLGGTGGVVGGALPVSGDAAPTGVPNGGGGGSGGAASTTGAAQAGSAGANYGAGGGGGGASLNGNASGAGGAGAGGIVQVITYF